MRITAKNLACERGGRRVFEGLAFDVSGGEALVITGHNGAGKSTLLRTLAGFLPLASGEISLDGFGDDTILSECAHYLGHQDAIKPQLTLRENLDFWSAMLTGDKRTAIDALARLALDDLADLPARFLSAGQRRRLALARLLVVQRPVWLLDEPTTAIDSASEARLSQLMADHLASGGLVIAATHAPLGLIAPKALRMGAAHLPATTPDAVT